MICGYTIISSSSSSPHHPLILRGGGGAEIDKAKEWGCFGNLELYLQGHCFGESESICKDEALNIQNFNLVNSYKIVQ